MKITEKQALQMMYKLAGKLKSKWSKDTERKIWELAETFDIFVGELDQGIQIEDDVFYFERF